MIFSILFPPFGIIPGIKYLKIPDQKAKFVGISAILITIIFTIMIFVFFMNFINGLYGSIDSINQTNYLLNNSIQDQAEQLQNLSQ